jgi:hypothetical protein
MNALLVVGEDRSLELFGVRIRGRIAEAGEKKAPSVHPAHPQDGIQALPSPRLHGQS